MTWRVGVDVLCFGGTKNSMAAGEAILFFNLKLAEDFDYRCKQAGQLASKMRFLAAPWVGLLDSGAWLRNGDHGNACAQRLSQQINEVPRVEIMFPPQANAVFVRMPEASSVRCAIAAGGSYTFIKAAPASCSHGTPIRSRWIRLAADIERRLRKPRREH